VTKTFKTERRTCVWTVALLLAYIAAAQDAVLHIKIVAGDGVAHPPGSHVGKPLTVEVTDATGQPVAGARVSFQVPEEGPGGLFPNGLRTDLATTDSNGRATVRGLQLNRIAGSFNVRITAAKEQARAGTVARLSIGGAGDPVESADRKTAAPTVPAKTEPAAAAAAAPVQAPVSNQKAAAAPKQSAPATPTVTMPGATSKAPVQVAAQLQPSASETKTSAPLPGTVPTIIVTQKSSQSATEIGGGGKSHKKWIWIGLLAAGGAGAAFAASSLAASAAHTSAGNAAGIAAGLSSAVTIGSPTITIGKQ
jgi:hypothetical protein